MASATRKQLVRWGTRLFLVAGNRNWARPVAGGGGETLSSANGTPGWCRVSGGNGNDVARPDANGQPHGEAQVSSCFGHRLALEPTVVGRLALGTDLSSSWTGGRIWRQGRSLNEAPFAVSSRCHISSTHTNAHIPFNLLAWRTNTGAGRNQVSWTTPLTISVST